ncbi:MAG: AAA family ATPase [Acidihalobacter sp.]|uniref:AAA family ATPase n=1 Tax=Acidihalobacter sp. TaxID=1872108 RepID=UPI00307F2F7A
MSIIERAAEKLRASQKAGSENNGLTPEQRTEAQSKASTPELMDSRLLDAEQPPGAVVPEKPRLSVHVDLSRLQTVGLLPSEASREQLESEYRRIKRPLLANVTGRGAVKVDRGRLIMITSALPGEGKTFTAFNLARSLAQEPDWEVVLIDGDNVRQSLTRHLGLQASKGLMDVLSQTDADVEDIVVGTDIPRLLVVPAGTRHALATEYLSSQHMETVLDRLAGKRNRVLLFDAPPLLGAPEALVLAEAVGQIMVVVKAGATERKAVAAAVQPLDRKKAINFLLNQVVRAHGDSYGGYHYGYRYEAQPDGDGRDKRAHKG